MTRTFMLALLLCPSLLSAQEAQKIGRVRLGGDLESQELIQSMKDGLERALPLVEEELGAKLEEGKNGVALRTKPLSSTKFSISADFIIHAGGTEQADLILALDVKSGNLAKLAIGASGYVSLITSISGKWETIAEARGGSLTLGGDEWHKVEVSVESGVVKAAVGATKLEDKFDLKVPTEHLRTGVGACASFVRWRNIKIEESAPKADRK